MNDIKKWLESETPDYYAGISLLSKYSKNKAILHYLNRKVVMSKLRYELDKIASGSKSIVKKQTIVLDEKHPPKIDQQPKAERAIIDIEGKIKYEDLPDNLKILYDKNTEKYKILRGAHAEMKAVKGKTKRQKLRKQIAELDDAIAKNWDIIDKWVAEGKASEDDNIDITLEGENADLTPQQVNAIRTYISRSLAEPEKIDDKKREKIQERINAMLANQQNFDDETIAKLKELGFTTENISPKD
ncbi:MAG: hypothetical protein LBQ28_04630 [Prevotellaceae bacterium]|jgi:hypothetical protein|nr:hypothetical protein [Prevotellaceae bacterium]